MTKLLLFFLLSISPVFGNHLNRQIQELESYLLMKSPDKTECFHLIKEVTETEIILEDESVWKIGWYYRSAIKDWKKGDRLKISKHSNSYSNSIKFENIDTIGTTWGNLEKQPNPELGDFLASIFNSRLDPEGKTRIILHSGSIFKGANISWKIRDRIFVFYTDKAGEYDLWNFDRNEIVTEWTMVADNDGGVLNLKENLSKHVLGQPEAIQTVAATIFNYVAGLNDPKTPIGVFLFLGPTGVGKTELAKVLTNELFKNQKFLIRFDMSHFVESHSGSRLIGSPPGYVNHEEGGQLTEALKAKPKSIVLLDEIEKAHPAVRKLFLPVFDEGYITDSKNRKVFCNNAVFILTSNICSKEIADLFNQNSHLSMDGKEVLEVIEPALIEHLSPELYNRVIPVIFRPLSSELMYDLVDKMLKEVIERLQKIKNITLIVDESAKKYLSIHGYHPTLGARPLKRLIQKKVIATLSHEIVYQSIPDGSFVTLYYNDLDDSWFVTWL